MDRNTLTALLLITVVLILTPYYMDLVSPPQESNRELFEDDYVENNDSSRLVEEVTGDFKNILPQQQNSTVEKTTVVESDLFVAKISSLFGGSITSFKIKNHLLFDSSFVNLITGENENNLAISFKNLDGEKTDLKNGWSSLQSIDSVYLNNEPYTVKHENNLDNKKVTKTITLYPDGFLMDVEIDITELSEHTLTNSFSLNWNGGLPPTEQDTVNEQTFFGAYLYQGGELLDVKVSSGESFSNNYKGQTDWVAIRNKYFVVSFLDNVGSQITGSTVAASFENNELYDFGVDLESDKIATLSVYLGPLEYDRIKALHVNLESVMNFGWAIIRPIAKGVLWVLKSMHTVIPNYGVILILFSIMVKLLVYPLTKKSYQSTQAMQAIQPEINNLREKYKNNPTKLNQATMELYKKKGVNPLGTCFPMLLQMPLLISLFTVFRSTIELRGEPFVFWIKDLSAPDIIFNLPFKVPIYGDYVCALPILMALSMYAQQKMMTPSGPGPQQQQQKMMQYFMMGFFFLLFNSFPSGLNLYYTLFNVLTIAQQKLTGSGQVTKT